MTTTRKQKEARNSREAEMLSDIESLDFMLGCNHLGREGSEFSDFVRRPDIPKYNVPENNQEDSYPNSRENRSSNSANYGHNSAGTDSCAEFNRLSGELNLKFF